MTSHIMPPDQIVKLARAVQPLVFETGIAEFPYSAAGTVFLVRYKGSPFVLTTRHALNPDSLGPICIFPSDVSHRLSPLRDVFYVSKGDVDEDYVDLAVLAIDMLNIAHSEVAQAVLIDMILASGDWQTYARDSTFVIIGFPEEHSFVDCETQTINTTRVVLHASYVGPSPLQFLHELEITNTHSLTTFSGFSGSPVFAWIQPINQRPRVVLCGMAIRGTRSSGRIHFLDRSVLLDALNVKMAIG
jgi:hypothetical protein